MLTWTRNKENIPIHRGSVTASPESSEVEQGVITVVTELSFSPICSLPLAHNCRYIKRQPSAPCHIRLPRSKLEAAPGHSQPHVRHSSL